MMLDNESQEQESKKNTPVEVHLTNENTAEDANQEAVNAIDAIVANSSEQTIEETPEKAIDYSALNLEELVEKLKGLLASNSNLNAIKDNVNAIKNVFNAKFSKLLAEKKEAFLEAGGNTIDFRFDSPIKVTFNSLLRDFKKRQQAYFKERENNLNQNLSLRNQVIEDLKSLIDNGEESTMYNAFKALQDRWRTIGPVPRATYNDTWKIYHHHVERFYDLLHMRNDLRDLDFKHNLEEKLKLIQKVKDLAVVENITIAFNELQEIHKTWKEEIGPVSRDLREQVWQQFSEATKVIHDKKHAHYKELRKEYEANIDKKLAVISEIEAYDTTANQKHSDWQRSIKEIEALREQFFAIGKVPKSKSDVIWEKFKDATKKFNREKNAYFKTIKSQQQENLTKKKALIKRAEELKDSEDWEVTTEVMKKIQSDWKKIGHVPKQISDKVWKQFKGACNHYFDKLHKVQDIGKQKELEIYAQKKEKLEALKETFSNEATITLKQIQEAITAWRSLGKVPFKVRYIEGKFNKLIDTAFSKLDISKKEAEMLRFKNTIESFIQQNDFKKLDNEQYYLRKKIDETVREIQLFENNISFFSNAKKDNPLIKNVLKNIEDHKEELAFLKEKLSFLKKVSN